MIRSINRNLPDHSTIKINLINKQVFKTWGDLLSLILQWKTSSLNWCEILARIQIMMSFSIRFIRSEDLSAGYRCHHFYFFIYLEVEMALICGDLYKPRKARLNSYVLWKNKPYFDRSREIGGSFWRKETNDFLCNKIYIQQTINRVLNTKWNKQRICKSSKRVQCSHRWSVFKSKMHMQKIR